MGKGNQYPYIHNLARTLIGQLHIDKSELGWAPHILHMKRAGAIKARLSKMNPGTLGKIISHGKGGTTASGKTSMYEVHPESHILHGTGMDHLMFLATVAIVAEMTDILQPKTFGLSEL